MTSTARLCRLLEMLCILRGGNNPSSGYEVVRRMFRIMTTAEQGAEAVFSVALEVKRLEASNTLTRIFQ